MKKVFLALVALGLMAWCYFQFKDLAQRNDQQTQEANVPFEYEVDRFADIRILRYKLDGFDRLTPKQKELVYYLTMAGLAGRDIMWDQNCKYNLEVRATLEKIYTTYTGDKSAAEWLHFETTLFPWPLLLLLSLPLPHCSPPTRPGKVYSRYWR
mgnify:CR=1 FL=1